MILPARILSRMAVVHAQLAADGALHTSIHVVHGNKVTGSDWESMVKSVVLVVVCGHGVVTKPDDSQIAARVRADDETFLWSVTEGRISFMRRGQLQALGEELEARKIFPARFCCIEQGADFETAAVVCVDRFRRELRWKGLIRLTNADSAIAQALARRLALPMLGGFLLLLSGNMLLSSGLNTRQQVLQTELAEREQTSSQTASTNAAQLQIAREFGSRPVLSRAIVCDRIARAVPERMLLTGLDVEPVVKRFETGKPLERRVGVVIVRGTAPTAAAISQFVERLSEMEYSREVRLINVEKQRDADCLSFRIDLKI